MHSLATAADVAPNQRETALRNYLDHSFPCEVTNVRVQANGIVIEGRTLAMDAPLFLAEAPIFAETADSSSLIANERIQVDTEDRFRIRVDRFAKEDRRQRDRLFSRWAIAKQPGAALEPLSRAHYPDIVESSSTLPEERPRGRKGLSALWTGRPLTDLDDLGISAVTVNIRLNSLMRMTPGTGRSEFSYGNRTWYVDDHSVERLDSTLREAARRHIIVSAIILISKANESPDREYGKLIAHPDAVSAGTYVMPNVNSREGHLAYAAALEFLARRYSQPDGKFGRIHHWIMHNEVDAGWEWTNAGEKSALEYLDLYQKSMRTAFFIARQYDSHAKVFISLTHYWTERANPHFYPSRKLLELLLEFCRAEGDFEWAIAHHPYPQNLGKPRTWQDKKATFSFDTPQITFKNLEVLDAWVRQPSTFYLGKYQRTIHLTEQGLNSPDYSAVSLRDQAAGMAYAWNKLKVLKSIKVFHYHNWVDNRGEGGLRIGLRRFPDDKEDPHGRKPIWDVYRALDTDKEEQATAFAKEVIGITNWTDIRYQGQIK
jgi:hypothetical protein